MTRKLTPALAAAAGVAAIVSGYGAQVAVSARSVAGSWRRLPPAPIAAPYIVTSVWTGRQMLVYGRTARNRDVAAAYTPAANRWRSLPAGPGPTGAREGRNSAVWTGARMLVVGITNGAFDPRGSRWRALPPSPLASGPAAVVTWTGRELLEWGGGCCGDSSAAGAAYDPVRNVWRLLPRAPLAGRNITTGAWTGSELVIAGGGNAEGRLFNDAAAFNPSTSRWRRLPKLPIPLTRAQAVWDGRDLLVVGGETRVRGRLSLVTRGFAYSPRANRWRRLPAMDSGRVSFAAVWSGRRLYIWGGLASLRGAVAAHGLVFDPAGGSWRPLPASPLRGRADPAGIWSGREMIVWGGSGTRDGAAFRPR